MQDTSRTTRSEGLHGGAKDGSGHKIYPVKKKVSELEVLGIYYGIKLEPMVIYTDFKPAVDVFHDKGSFSHPFNNEVIDILQEKDIALKWVPSSFNKAHSVVTHHLKKYISDHQLKKVSTEERIAQTQQDGDEKRGGWFTGTTKGKWFHSDVSY